MSIGDYVNPTWTNNVTKLNATNLQTLTNKIYELDQHLAKQCRYVKKASDEIVNNSTTFQDDNDFNVTLLASKIYKIDLFLACGSGAGSSGTDIKLKWVVGGGCTQLTCKHCNGPTVTSTDITNGHVRRSIDDLAISVAYGIDGVYNTSIHESFMVQTNASGGTLKLQWAQDTAGAVNTAVWASGSFMIIQQVLAWS